MSEIKKKRAGKRFPYQAQGQCVVNEETFSCALEDISVSGVQISTDHEFEPKQQISLAWDDKKEGEIEGSFYVMRKFEKEEVPGVFFYGLRYYQLDQVGKQRVINILNLLRNVQTKEHEKISLESIYEVVDEGKMYIEKHLENLDGIHEFFAKPLKNLQPYEISAFIQDPDDPYNMVISDFVTAHFHCVILKNVVPFALKKPKRIPSLLARATTVLEFIETTEVKEEAIFEHIKDLEQATDLRMQYNESTNRVFYGKQAMMEKIVKGCAEVELVPEAQASLEYISERYDRSVELTNPNIGMDDIHTVSKYQPREEEKQKSKESTSEAKYNREDSQYYVPDLETKGLGKKIIAGVVTFLFLASLGYKLVASRQDTREYRGKLQLPIPIQKAEREGAQVLLYFDDSDWDTLTEVQKDSIREYLRKYLLEEKWLRTAMLRTDDADIKMIVTTMQ